MIYSELCSAVFILTQFLFISNASKFADKRISERRLLRNLFLNTSYIVKKLRISHISFLKEHRRRSNFLDTQGITTKAIISHTFRKMMG